MTQDSFLITPPDELVEKWTQTDENERFENFYRRICTQAARWGADQELEASVAWLIGNQNPRWAAALQEARRPKPPSLKEQALAELELLRGDLNTHGLGFDAPAIRRALEALPD